MLYINHITYNITAASVPIINLATETNLNVDMLKIFSKFYGLKNVLVSKNTSVFELICVPVQALLTATNLSPHSIKYLIHGHTAPVLTTFGDSIIRNIKKKFSLNQAIAFGTHMYKCVGLIKIFSFLENLLESRKPEYAIVIGGEIAFTPELRVIPGSSIGGDAAVAALISNQGQDHAVLSVQTNLLPGYQEGIYLTPDQLKKFDDEFIITMNATIKAALAKAQVALADIALILPHNVNYLTWRRIAKSLDYPMARVYLDKLTDFGHCYTADGLLNLVFALKEQRLKKGDYYLMVGCGMGFYFACAVLQY
jgi:3-oxoacyl-[acyl-carrier-protein] synthase-3